MELYNVLKMRIMDEYPNEIKTEEVIEFGYNYCLENKISLKSCILVYTNKNVCNCITQNIYKNDIVKIEFDTTGDVIGETFVYGKCENTDEKIRFLDKLEKKIKRTFVGNSEEYVNDDIRIFIETECAKKKLSPIVNCKSVCESEYKYIMLNYKNVNGELNECFDINIGEKYILTLYIVEYDNDIVSEGECEVFNLCEEMVNLKLNSSRSFYKNVKAKFSMNKFHKSLITEDARTKVGMTECINKGLLIRNKNLKAKGNVLTKKFLLII